MPGPGWSHGDPTVVYVAHCDHCRHYCVALSPQLRPCPTCEDRGHGTGRRLDWRRWELTAGDCLRLAPDP